MEKSELAELKRFLYKESCGRVDAVSRISIIITAIALQVQEHCHCVLREL